MDYKILRADGTTDWVGVADSANAGVSIEELFNFWQDKGFGVSIGWVGDGFNVTLSCKTASCTYRISVEDMYNATDPAQLCRSEVLVSQCNFGELQTWELSPPPPELLAPPTPRCEHAGKRETRADYAIGWVFGGHLEVSSNRKLFGQENNARRTQATVTLKRQLREWPTCSFGGSPELVWDRVKGIEGKSDMMEAYWFCAHCEQGPEVQDGEE